MLTNTFNKLTRRGKVLKMLKEHYLRDDIPCGMAGCGKCPSMLESDGHSDTDIIQLSNEPSDNTIVVLDTNIVLHQIDLLEASGGILRDVVILQTVLEEVKHRNMSVYQRLRALLRDPTRRFCPFSNLHHRDTYSLRRAGETANDYNDRLIREACSWLRSHFADLEIKVVLLTHDVANARFAQAAGLTALTVGEFVSAAVKAAPEHAKLLDLVALPAADPEAGPHSAGAGPSDAASDAGSVASSSASSIAAQVQTVTPQLRKGAVYREHLTQSQINDALKSRSVFQGSLRVNRDCWFEGRVVVHGVQGKGTGAGSKDSGGDDALPVIIVGRDNVNRAMDGDTVVIELLPQSQWKHQAARLSMPSAAEAAQDDAAAGAAQAQPSSADAAISAAADSDVAMDDGDAAAAASSATSSATVHSQQSLAALAAKSAGVGGSIPTGRVVGIIKRAWRPLCGSLEPEEQVPGIGNANASAAAAGSGTSSNMESALFSPVDGRYPRIRIETRQKWSLMDKRLVVAVDTWDVFSKYPRGHYVRTLGVIGDKAAENEVIMLEHDIVARPFGADVLACLPPADWSITAANSVGRTDLRHIDVCSIDPPGCKDIDDALHARALDETGDLVEVGVHIADVSYFVRHNTAIDQEAAARANTTYLVERRLDMLPGLLTETLCSLKGGVDRFAFSVTWQFRRVKADAPASDPKYQKMYESLKGADRWEEVPGSAHFFKSIIHSRAAMTYAQAQTLLDDPSADTPVARGVKLLASVARSLKRRRIEDGALQLASSEVKVMLDSETADPVDVMAYEMRETNSTVEEWMLMGNIAVAKRIVASYPRASCLRRHPAPPESSFAVLKAAAKAVGVELNCKTSRELADSLDAAEVSGNPFFNKLLRIMTTRSMMQAVYFPSGEVPDCEHGHYGLGVPVYTHFTSPIRRYCDVVVHRTLAAALGIDPFPVEYQDKVRGSPRMFGATAAAVVVAAWIVLVLSSLGLATLSLACRLDHVFSSVSAIAPLPSLQSHVRMLTDNMNKRHLMSQLAGRASSALHTQIFFRNRVVVETGLVMRLRGNGVIVLVPKFGLEGSVVLGRSDKDDRPLHAWQEKQQVRTLKYDEGTQTIWDINNPDTHKLRIFQAVKVALMVEEKVRGRKELVYKLIEPAFATLPKLEDLPAGTVIEDRTAPAASSEAGTAASSSSSSSAAAGAVVGAKRPAAAVSSSPAASGAAAGRTDKKRKQG